MTAALQCASVLMETERATIALGLRRRDPEVLEALIERYQHRVFRYLLYFTRDRALAEDTFQETWLRVVERGAQYNPRFAFEAWLLTVARNVAIDQMRRRRPMALAETAAQDAAEDESGPADPPTADPSPFDLAAENEQARRVAAALAGIPAYYREALTLRFHEDLSLQEIAEVTRVPLSTAKSRVRRGLDLLSRLWQETR
ncbi:MAG: RNA polymerase sigma factor [Acidobacteriota bacterium]